VSHTIWKHFLHKEDKSLGPDGSPCHEYTRGLLLRRPVQASTPFEYIGKEVERRAQEGEDLSLLEQSGPIRYGVSKTPKTRSGDPRLVERARLHVVRKLMRESVASQHAIERFLGEEPVHPATRARLAEAVEKLERERGVQNP
jgi:hypothetical protein